MTRGNPPEEIP